MKNSQKKCGFLDLDPYLIDRYKELVRKTHLKLSKERWKKSFLSVLLSLITVIGNISIVIVILVKAKEGFIYTGSLVITIQALVMTQFQLAGCIANLGMCAPILLFFKKLDSFIKNPLCPISKGKISLSPTFLQEIRLENVSFSYSDGRKALSNVNFSIRPGEKIAIVGENGAGKSTLVKLLLRF